MHDDITTSAVLGTIHHTCRGVWAGKGRSTTFIGYAVKRTRGAWWEFHAGVTDPNRVPVNGAPLRDLPAVAQAAADYLDSLR